MTEEERPEVQKSQRPFLCVAGNDLDMSNHDVSGVVGWCLGAHSEVENTYVHHLHTFLQTEVRHQKPKS